MHHWAIVLIVFIIGLLGQTLGGPGGNNEMRIKTVTAQWDDLRVPVSSLVGLPIGLRPFAEPDWAEFPTGGGTTEIFVRCFDPSTVEGLFFAVQLPHSYREGTDLKPHVHWAPATTNTGSVVWEINCSGPSDIDGTFSAPAANSGTDAADGTQDKHQVAGLGTIDGTGKKISSMLACNIVREAGDGADTFTGDACLIEVDFHFQKNSFGSEQELVK